MSDYLIQTRQEQNEELDRFYQELHKTGKLTICKNCKNDLHLINTAGYWYCTNCTNDEVEVIQL